MNEKDAQVIKILADLKIGDQPELSDEQEEMLRLALDPEAQYLANIEKLFTKTS